MAQTIKTTEPIVARAGESWAWVRNDLAEDYPSSAWTLVYAFRNASAHFDLTAAAEADDTYSITLAPATTAAYAPGDYLWIAWVQQFETETDAETGEEVPTETLAARHQVGTGTLSILPDLSTTIAHDPRTWAKRMLDAVEAMLEARASTDQLDLVETTLGDRNMKRDRSSLIELRSQLQIEVARETGTGARVRRILTRFT